MSHLFHLVAATYLDFVSALFGIGMIGCLAVLLMTFYEDVTTVLGYD